MTRYHELATQAVRRWQVLGVDPVRAVEQALRQIVQEHSAPITGCDARRRGMNRTAAVLERLGTGSVADVAAALRTSRKVAWVYLRRLVRARQAAKISRGLYRLRAAA